MIYNRQLEYLLTSRCLQDFSAKYQSMARICDTKDRYSILLVHDSYVVELSEIIIDNYVEIWLSDMSSGLWVSSADAHGICSAVNIPAAIVCKLDDISIERAFIRFHSEKAVSFPMDLCWVDSLLAFIASKGGCVRSHILPHRRRSTIAPTFALWHIRRCRCISCCVLPTRERVLH